MCVMQNAERDRDIVVNDLLPRHRRIAAQPDSIAVDKRGGGGDAYKIFPLKAGKWTIIHYFCNYLCHDLAG